MNEDCSLAVSGREQDFPTNVTERAHGFALAVSERFSTVVSEREKEFSTNISEQERGFSLGVSKREYRQLFRVVSIWRLSGHCNVTRSRSSLVPPSNLGNMHLLPRAHTLVCFKSDSPQLTAIVLILFIVRSTLVMKSLRTVY